MYTMLEHKLERITPDRAKEILSTFGKHPAQRPINERHVDLLRQKILNGQFRVGNIALASNSDGVNYSMNGNHTMHAVIKADKIIEALVEYFHCDDDSDFAELFRQFDLAWSTRSAPHINAVEARAMGVDWSPRIVSLVVAAASMLAGSYSTERADERVERLKSNIEVGNWVNDMLHNGAKSSRHMTRNAVVAAMMKTWKKNRTDASQFWTNVHDGEMLTKRSPEYLLREFLLTHTIQRGVGALPSKVTFSVKDHEVMYRCIIAWNAFRRGDDRSVIRYCSDKPVPAAV